MAIYFYNTLTRCKEKFESIEPRKVRFYSCGPTVHDYAHIGNLKTFVVFDLIKRYLIYRGYQVDHIMNITDVEDKIIKKVKKNDLALEELTEQYSKAFFEDLKSLNILPATQYPKATDHVFEIVQMVNILIEKGYAYERDGSFYFSIRKSPSYGELAGLDLKGIQTATSGMDTDEYDKEDARDFVLWKAWKEEDGDVFWESDLGKGRPGWHMECSCMAIKYLGETIDIHAGAVDLIFPHHQNEIAQSEAVTGVRFVNTWIHGAHINVADEKMSKSLGNFLTLRDILTSSCDAQAFRYLVVSSHYRTAFNFSREVLEGAKRTMRHLKNFRMRLKEVETAYGTNDVLELVVEARKKFVHHMNDDLNSPRAIAAVFELVNGVEGFISRDEIDTRGAEIVDLFMEEVDQVLGVFYTLSGDEREEILNSELKFLLAEREKARSLHKWEQADEIRDRFQELGYRLEDTPEGTIWKKT